MQRLFSQLALILTTGTALACGAPPTDEDLAEAEALGEASQSIWESACNTHLDDTQAFTFNESHPSGYGYSDCNKTLIQEVTNFNKTNLIDVLVRDASPAGNETDCENSWAAAQLFIKSGSNWLEVTTDDHPSYTQYGTWIPANPPFAASCNQIIDFPASLFTNGATHRIHATVRTGRTGNTKAFHMENRYSP